MGTFLRQFWSQFLALKWGQKTFKSCANFAEETRLALTRVLFDLQCSDPCLHHAMRLDCAFKINPMLR